MWGEGGEGAWGRGEREVEPEGGLAGREEVVGGVGELEGGWGRWYH